MNIWRWLMGRFGGGGMSRAERERLRKRAEAQSALNREAYRRLGEAVGEDLPTDPSTAIQRQLDMLVRRGR